MRTPTTAGGWHGDEAGTAALETLLVLPFIFLVCALILDVGYGWVVRARAEAAVRYAATTYTQFLDGGGEPAAAAGATEAELRRAYYSQGEAFELGVGDEVADVAGAIREQGAEPPPGEVSGALSSLGQRLSGRHRLRLRVPRHVPTGTLLADSPVQVAFAVDGNSWTYAEVPLGLAGLTGLGSRQMLPIKIVTWAAEGPLWLLGMEADAHP